MTIPPVPVVARVRAFPATLPHPIREQEPFPERISVFEHAVGPDGRTTCGAYVGDGPGLEHVAGRFLGPATPDGPVPPGPGPLRGHDNFLDRLIWRLIHESRFGFVSWDPAAFFASTAYTFKHGGLWAVIFTYTDPDGERAIDYFRSPIVFEPKTDGGIEIAFGPRKKPQPRDFEENGRRQYRGRFLGLRDASSALIGEKVEDLATACRLFDIEPPPAGPATVTSLPMRIAALRHLYRAVRSEAELWP